MKSFLKTSALSGFRSPVSGLLLRLSLFAFHLSLVAACSTGRAPVASFSPPTAAPIRMTVTKAREHVAAAAVNSTAAKTAIAQAAATVKTLLVAAPEHRVVIERLTLELDQARIQIDALTAHLLDADTDLRLSQDHIAALEKQVVAQTNLLNDNVVAKNQALAKSDKLTADLSSAVWQRNKLGIWLAVVVGGIALFFFRRPLGMLLGIPIP